VRPRAVTLKESTLRLGETLFQVEGGFVPGVAAARDAARLSIGVAAFDADAWLVKMAGPKNAAISVPASKPDIAAIARSIALPFDLEMSAQAEGIRFKGRDYTQFAMKGKLAGAHLDIETFRL